jgi:YHS domain-containing protein
VQIQLPPGCPPLGLEGNCPVTLVERQDWVLGVATFGAVHRGRTYLFLGPTEREKFLADPDRYSPVLSGIDPVMALDNRGVVAGRREFGVFGADGHIYLFADAASRERFEQNEKHYATEVLKVIR